ncbi:MULTISPECIES: 50S ribosomal protein L33 [unclassified Sporolactobacillus]|nr:50S ribosomal protein L33 [Sporolactobacillus sp. CQH2019]MDD9150504.1 50S ribosomal protein L33 [Sporolactobacillus sp. CQH2019]
MRKKIVLACSVCNSRNYTMTKKADNDRDRAELNKYCKTCKAYTLHRETK